MVQGKSHYISHGKNYQMNLDDLLKLKVDLFGENMLIHSKC